MEARYKLPFEYNIELLKTDLEIALNFNWKDHYSRHDYSGNWTLIPLWSLHGSLDELKCEGEASDYKPTALLKNCSYFQSIIDQFKCDKTRVCLMKLDPNSNIKTHVDRGLSYLSGSFRVHIPIQTLDELYFYHAEERVVMEEGSCWYLNFELPHRVENKGTIPRVHFVMDCERNEWSDKLFAALGYDFEYEDEVRYAHFTIDDMNHIMKNIEQSNVENKEIYLNHWKTRINKRLTKK